MWLIKGLFLNMYTGKFEFVKKIYIYYKFFIKNSYEFY